MGLKDQILAYDDLQHELVTVDEWGGVVLEVRGMDGAERAKALRSFTDPETGQVDFVALYPVLVIASVFDPETGAKVFDDGDVQGLLAKNGGALEKVAAVAARLSGLAPGAVAEGKDDSTPTPSDASTSSSPSDSAAPSESS